MQLITPVWKIDSFTITQPLRLANVHSRHSFAAGYLAPWSEVINVQQDVQVPDRTKLDSRRAPLLNWTAALSIRVYEVLHIHIALEVQIVVIMLV